MQGSDKTGRAVERYVIGKDSLSESEVILLLSKVTDMADLVLLRIAIEGGIRREDIVAIEVDNITISEDEESATVRFREGKKNRTWQVVLGKTTTQALQIYLKTLPKGCRWLFPSGYAQYRSVPKNHIAGRTAYRSLQVYLAKAGQAGRPFHALRSTCMKLLQKKGWPIERIMAQTGDTQRTIQMHYTVPNVADMRETMRDRPVL